MIKTIVTGALEENCHLVQPEPGGRLFVIDPGADAAEIIAAIRKIDFSGIVILLTHAHFDHIGAALAVQREFNAPCYLNPADRAIYESPANAYPPFYPALPAAGRAVTTAEAAFPEVELIPTPGHSPGGTSFYFKSVPALFPGDTIFASSVGRTDFPGGDHRALMDSIHRKILVLPDNTPIYPGHGGATSAGREKRVNPYL